MIVYISGAITANENYKQEFNNAKEILEKRGFKVINPAAVDLIATDGAFGYEDYMAIDFKLIDIADSIVLLHGWEKSPGANREYGYSVGTEKDVLFFDVLAGGI